MNPEALMDRLQLKGAARDKFLKNVERVEHLHLVEDVRDLFLLRLHGTQVKWEALNATQWPVTEWVHGKPEQTTLEVTHFPDNKKLKRKLEQYWSAIEKALQLAREMPYHLTEIQPDQNASDNDRDGWKQNPPHPTDYLQYALWESQDWPKTFEARMAGDTDAVIYRNRSELLIKMPKTATHKRDVLLNNLEDMFRIAYPKIKPVIYRDGHAEGYENRFTGAFHDFLITVLPLIDTSDTLLTTLSQRFEKRPN